MQCVDTNDMELLRRYTVHGDRDAIACLIRRHQKPVFRACMRRLGCHADAEDATQQVFLALMQCGGGINSSVSQWLYRCSVNIAASIIRSRRNRIRREREKGRRTNGVCGNGEAERRETAAILMQCLGKIDAADQKALIQNHVHGVTQQSIASSMGVTQQAVAKRIGRALLFLRRELSSRGVIFSLVFALMLLARRAANAVPQRLKDAFTFLPPAPLSSGGATGAGTAGMLKAGAAVVLMLAAAATYECVEGRLSETTNPPAAAVSLVSAEKPSGGDGTVAHDSFKGNATSAVQVSLDAALPRQTAPARQASRPDAPSGAKSFDSPLSRQFDLASSRPLQRQSPPALHGEPGWRAALPSTAEFPATSFPGRRFDLLPLKDTKGANLEANGVKTIGQSLLEVMAAGETVDLAAGGEAAIDQSPSDTIFGEGNRRRTGLRMNFLLSRQTGSVDIEEWGAPRTRPNSAAVDAASMRIADWPMVSEKRFAGLDLPALTVAGDSIGEGGIGYNPTVNTVFGESSRRRASLRMNFLLSRQTGSVDIEEWDTPRSWPNSATFDPVSARFMTWPVVSENHFRGVNLLASTVAGDSIGEVYLRYRFPTNTNNNLRFFDSENLSGFVNIIDSRIPSPTLNYFSEGTSDAYCEDLVNAGDDKAISQEWAISTPSTRLIPNYDVIISSNGTTVPIGATLSASGMFDDRLINQGLVVADGEKDLYLTNLVSGAGSFRGNIVFTGGFSPGNSPADVYLDYAAFDRNNTLTMEIGGLIAGKQYDQIIVMNNLMLGGHLEVILLDGFVPRRGDKFTLFDGSLSGQFSDITLPTLNDGLHWNTSGLYTEGILQVAPVPEPASMVLPVTAGFAALLCRKRRKRG